MLPRLAVSDTMTSEAARKRFDVQVRTEVWPTPGQDMGSSEETTREPGAPWWWDGEEEAASSFLDAMGVTLDG